MKLKTILLVTLLGSSSFALAAEPASLTTEWQTKPHFRSLDGVLEAVHESTVSAQTAGTVIKINVDVNDFVPANTVIMELDSTEASARLQQAKAQLAEAQSSLAAVSANHQRIAQLYGQQMVSKADFDRSKAALDGATSRLKLTEAGVTEAEKQLSYTKVEAPYSGIVKKRLIQLGETAQPGKPLMAGLSLDAQRVVFNIPQTMISALRDASSLDVVLPDNSQVTASHLTIFPDADQQSHTFKARADLPEKISHLYPGMLVKVKVPVATRQVMQLPASALVQRGEVFAVYVKNDNNEFALRQVRVGEISRETVEVLSGLVENETVMTDALQIMRTIAGDRP